MGRKARSGSVRSNAMSGATNRAPEFGRCSISWPSNPPESGLQPHLRRFPALLNASLYSGRHGAARAVDSGAPGRIWIKLDEPAQCPLPLPCRHIKPKRGNTLRRLVCHPITPEPPSPNPAGLLRASLFPVPDRPPPAPACSHRQGRAVRRCRTASPDRPAARPGSGS